MKKINTYNKNKILFSIGNRCGMCFICAW